KDLSEEGLAIVVVSIDFKTKQMLSGSDIISRGFVYMRESYGLIRSAEKKIKDDVNKLLNSKVKVKWINVKHLIIAEHIQHLYRTTKRSPMILPMIMRINDEKLQKKK